MFKLCKIISLFGLFFLSLSAQAQQVRIDSLRYGTSADYTRMTFDVTQSVAHVVFLLDNPARLVIDFKNTKLAKSLTKPPANHPIFKRIRSAPRNKNNLRVVLDLKQAVTPKSFALKPDKRHGHRMVVDLFKKGKAAAKNNSHSPKKTALKTVKNNKARDIIVAIDAGHGGVDPGALGSKGTQEKKVVLQIAKKLSKLINNKKGMKAVMVRKGDYFIELRKRMQIARDAKADLFVSIHADAYKNSKAKGASVYTLSQKDASSEAAKWLAKKENSADLIGGVKLADKGDDLASVLMDLSVTATKEASRNVAGKVLKNFKSIGHLHKHDVQKAGFVVLKSPDIPSILIETAFISNPSEEKKLKNKWHQKKMAKAIYKGIVRYFSQNAPADTYFAMIASKKHVISRGETLSEIAQYYGVSMKSIKYANAMASSRIRIGQVLTIPKG